MATDAPQPPPRAAPGEDALTDFIKHETASDLFKSLTFAQRCKAIAANRPPGLDDGEMAVFRRVQMQRILQFYEFHAAAMIALAILVWSESPNPMGVAAAWAVAAITATLATLSVGRGARRRLGASAPRLGEDACALGALKASVSVIWGAAFFLPGFQTLDPPFWILLIAVVGASAGAVMMASAAPLMAAAFIAPVQIAAQIAFARMALGGTLEAGGGGAPLPAMSALYCLVLAVLCLAQFLMFLEGALERVDCARQERRVRELLEEYEEHAGDWLWRVDAAGVLTYAPPRMSEAAGLTESLLGRKLEDLAIPGAGDSGFAIRGALNSKRPFRQVAVAVGRPDDVRRWRASGRPQVAPNGLFQGYFGVCAETTAAYEACEARRAAEAAQIESTRLRGRMIASVSHELRTPLNSIIGFAELIEDAAARRRSNERVAKFAADIQQAGLRLQGVIENMLQMAVIDADQAKLREDWLDLRSLLDSVLAMQGAPAQAREVALTLDGAPDVFVYGDEQRLWQALTNIASNAVKYAQRGGTAQARASLDDAGALRIDMIDDGPGVPEGRLEDAFQPFTRLEPPDDVEGQEGLGLGLPIARAFARAHGGDLVLMNRGGAGACARLTLPAARVRPRET